MAETRTVHVSISGRVQGVGFRAWLHTTARQLGVNGWVRNRRDGTVEAVLQGDDEQISKMLLCCEAGPPAARVKSVDVLGEVGASYDGFAFLPTE